MTPRALRMVCVVSILFNVFLVAGIAAGFFWLRTGRPIIRAGAMHIAGSELPGAERRAFRQTLRAARRDAHPLVVADHQARSDAAALLRGPTTDPQAFAAALARVREADMALRARI